MISNDPLWYKDAVIYELHVRAFQDSSNDGCGDFRGLLRRLPWLRELGVNCLWLLPFYPSPLRDDGYDIADYRGIHKDYGTLRDFKDVLEEAHRLGIRVITELVLNHTSDQHPWFQDARRAPKGSSKRNWYVWSDDPERYSQARIIFTDTETSNWTWDPVAHQYYWHRFFSHQPDLNFEHPPVRRAIEKVLKFWLDMGVDGVRLDAVPYLIEQEGTNCENLPETHRILRDLRRISDGYEPRRVFLAEANQWPQDVIRYFGDDGDECHMAYHFPLMPRLFMALAQEDSHPVVEILQRTPAIPTRCQWALFLRNHDELTLEMVTDKERDYLYRSYASEPRMRINVGIRRRLAPLLGNSRPRIELLNGLLLSLPGTPVLYYGDEIGMGDNIYLGDRNGVRTPMQWSPDRNAGFSNSEFARLFSPPVMDGIYGYQGLNVEAQEGDPSSLLQWMRRILHLRTRTNVFGRGSIRFLESSNRRILSFLREHESETILVVANFSRFPQPVDLPLEEFAGRIPVELFGGTPFPEIGEDNYPLALGPHGFYWFRLESPRERAENMRAGKWVTSRDSFPVLEIDGDPAFWWSEGPSRLSLQEHLAPWLLGRPWLHGTGESLDSCRILEVSPIAPPTVLLRVRADRSRGSRTEYGLMLCRVDGDDAERVLRSAPDAIVVRLKDKGADAGFLIDALSCPSGIDALLDGFHRHLTAGTFRFEHEDARFGAPSKARLETSSGHHPIIQCSDQVLKFFHHLHEGAHPVEGALRHLALSGFDRCPRLLGGIHQGAKDRLLALSMTRLPHQGNATERFAEAFRTHLETHQGVSPKTATDSEIPPSHMIMATQLGKRIGELHAALATEQGVLGFGKTAWTEERSGDLLQQLHRRLEQTTSSPDLTRVRRMLASSYGAVVSGTTTGSPGSCIRCHGDLHLGQILWNENDYLFVDFEGEQGTSFEERVRQRSPLHDLATVRLSLDEVARHAASTWHGPTDALGEQLPRWVSHIWRALMDGYIRTDASELLPKGSLREPMWTLHILDRISTRWPGGTPDMLDAISRIRNEAAFVGTP